MKIKRQILVVEDNLINREMLTGILEEEYTVLQAGNGRDALEILKRQKKDSIALILLDVMMPVMDGYKFLDTIKEDAELALIPIIVMTQSDREEDEVSALEHGATDFVPKPYRPSVIMHRVASLIKLRENAALVNQFKYDRLTELYSKEFFYRLVRERLDEDHEHEYSIICSNIENFKLYNDAFGLEKGDSLLKESAAVLRDMVGENGICGRYSADRFLCLQESEKERADRDRFFNSVYSGQSAGAENVSIKWGIYEITDRSVSVEQMCDRALLAADSIKGQYNIPFAVYDDELRSKLLREKTITDAMEIALAEGQFDVYMQPKYSLTDSSMVGAEALVRWIHPEWGFMSPGEFIPLFEKNGFIPKLDQYVWEKICEWLRDCREKGCPLPVVSVNVSRADIYQADLADTLWEIIQKYGVDPAYLHLEITESAYTENPDRIISTVEKLRGLGFIIEMDDFGSGYSSLNMFSRMNIDILKLDMKFVQNEIAQPEEQSVLNDIVSMAHRMHLGVVAEGVETREQMNRLRAIGCDYAQGYYFAKPMPIAEFEELWKSHLPETEKPLMNEHRDEAGMSILLAVDEDAEYRGKIRKTFDGQYRVMEASDAQSALDCIRKYGSAEIAVVILSVTLPGDGAALVLKVMQQEPRLWDIPVLSVISDCRMAEKMSEMPETDDFICKCHPMQDLRRRVRRLKDAAEFRERESLLQDAAGRDYLTGILNRRGFRAALASLRAEDLPLTVCLFDLDDLKVVNDTYGHDMGDRMLRSFAELLVRHTRTADIRCRYGGDEFVVVLKRFNDKQGVMKKGEDICRAFRDCLAEENISVSCSCGIAPSEQDEKMSDRLIECADRALYRAKSENKGGCCLWEEQ